MSSMSYFRICSMRSIQKTTFCGFIALLDKVLDFGGQLVNKFSFILFMFQRCFTSFFVACKIGPKTFAICYLPPLCETKIPLLFFTAFLKKPQPWQRVERPKNKKGISFKV